MLWGILLHVLCCGNVIDLDETAMPQLIADSWETPLFVVFYSTFCSKCDGFKEEFEEFQRGIGDREDVLLSLVNCHQQYNLCMKLGVTQVPVVKFIMGDNQRYWPTSRTLMRSGDEWGTFIDKYLAPNIYSLDESSKTKRFTELATQAISSGGVAFKMTVQNQRDSMLTEVRSIAPKYNFLSDIFAYQIPMKMQNTELVAYKTVGEHHCEIAKQQGETLEEFIEKHKYGVLHRYDLEEWNEVKTLGPTTMVVVPDTLMDVQSDAILSLASKLCGNMTFGWISVSELPSVLEEFGKNKSDLPFVVHSRNSTCHTFLHSRTQSMETSNLFDSDVPCGSAFGLKELPKVSYKQGNGYRFVIAYAAIGLGAIGLLRLKVIERKDE